MRCVLSKKKVEKLIEKTGLPIARATSRGGTNHTLVLTLINGKRVFLSKDGTIKSDDQLPEGN